VGTKQSKGKLKSKEPPKAKKAKEIISYKVLVPLWIRKAHRYPGYVLTAEDISAMKLNKGFDLNIKRKVIEAF